jgi:hypothetical protein
VDQRTWEGALQPAAKRMRRASLAFVHYCHRRSACASRQQQQLLSTPGRPFPVTRRLVRRGRPRRGLTYSRPVLGAGVIYPTASSLATLAGLLEAAAASASAQLRPSHRVSTRGGSDRPRGRSAFGRVGFRAKLSRLGSSNVPTKVHLQGQLGRDERLRDSRNRLERLGASHVGNSAAASWGISQFMR